MLQHDESRPSPHIVQHIQLSPRRPSQRLLRHIRLLCCLVRIARQRPSATCAAYISAAVPAFPGTKTREKQLLTIVPPLRLARGRRPHRVERERARRRNGPCEHELHKPIKKQSPHLHQHILALCGLESRMRAGKARTALFAGLGPLGGPLTPPGGGLFAP